MAHKTYLDSSAKIDNAAGTITSLASSVNQHSIASALTMLDDSAVSTEENTFLPGANQSTFSLNGWVNTTTEGIFGPLVGNRTSVTKTFALKNGVKWFTGEAYPQNTQFSGSFDTLMTWSCNFQITGAVTRTSTEPS